MKSWAYTADHIPFINNVNLYCNNWIKWWTSCQPAWCQNSEWPLPRNSTGATDWTKLCIHGESRLFLIIILTMWWAASIISGQDWVKFNKAVDDVHWVIGQILELLKALPVPMLPLPPRTSQDPPHLHALVGWLTQMENVSQSQLLGCWKEEDFNGVFLYCTIEYNPVPTHYTWISCIATSCRGWMKVFILLSIWTHRMSGHGKIETSVRQQTDGFT